MALDYTLKFTKKLKETEKLTELIENQDYKYFIISKLVTSQRGYIEGEFNDNSISLELGQSSMIGFRRNKIIDPLEVKKELVKVLHLIVNEIYPNEDYYFSFNGDVIYEKRIGNLVERNNKYDFFGI